MDLKDEYYFWFTKDLSIIRPFICELPFKAVACIENQSVGSDYQGNASRTASGEECLSWQTPGLSQLFPEQPKWDHNYCRNPGGLEEAPVCFVESQDGDIYDICDIPKCPTQQEQILNDQPVTSSCQDYQGTWPIASL